jgi:hypothetical protein
MENYRDPNSTMFSFYEYASAKYMVESSFSNSKLLLSMSSGGRTVNERPLECEIIYGADIYISSAYGSIMRSMIYPLGHPRYLVYSVNQSEKDELLLILKKLNILKSPLN